MQPAFLKVSPLILPLTEWLIDASKCRIKQINKESHNMFRNEHHSVVLYFNDDQKINADPEFEPSESLWSMLTINETNTPDSFCIQKETHMYIYIYIHVNLCLSVFQKINMTASNSDTPSNQEIVCNRCITHNHYGWIPKVCYLAPVKSTLQALPQTKFITKESEASTKSQHYCI